MRERVCSFTIELPRNARETVGCDTPARCAITRDVAFSLLRMTGSLCALRMIQLFGLNWSDTLALAYSIPD
jgi:hypothetical protein